MRRHGAPFYESTVEDGDCLRWTGAHSERGYGRFRDPETKKLKQAHRYAYELEIGPIPDGLTLDHVYARGCRFTDCVKVAHLEPVTNKVNHERSLWARKEQCPQGHEYDEKNTYITKKGHRHCRRCDADRKKARYQAKEKANASTYTA